MMRFRKNLILVLFVFLINSSFALSEKQIPGSFDELKINETRQVQEDAILPRVYIVKLKEESLSEKQVSIDKNLAELNSEKLNYVLKGDVKRAASIEKQTLTITNNNKNLLDKQYALLKKEHKKAISEITGIAISERGEVFAPAVIKSLTGKAVDESEVKVSEEYYRSFNGFVLEGVDESKVDDIKKSQYVEAIYPSRNLFIDITESASIIEADSVWPKDNNSNKCAVSKNSCLTGKDVRVAIFDTGIDYTHPDLGGCFGQGCKVEQGYDFVDEDEDPMDHHFHGTFVAGIVAANRSFGRVNMTNSYSQWEFDRVYDGKSEEVYDTNGNYNGITKNGVISVREGIKNTSVLFDGRDDYIEIPTNYLFVSGNSFTITGWFKTNRLSGNNTCSFISRRNSFILCPKLTGQVSLYAYLNGKWEEVQSNKSVVKIKTWQHYAGTYNGSSLVLYLNGQIIASRNVSGQLGNNGSMYIGADYGVAGRFFNGSVDSVYLYQSALSARQVYQLYVIQGEDFSIGNGSYAIQRPGGVIGIAPEARIHAYAVCNSQGRCKDTDILSAFERAIDPNRDGNFSDKVDVLSISLGSFGSPDEPLALAADNVVSLGTSVVASAGNDGPYFYSIGTPALGRKVIAVGSTDKFLALSDFSSRGPVTWKNGALLKPDILAPGQDILSTGYSAYLYASGTSFSAPHISGVAALIKQAHPTWGPEEIRQALRMTTTDIGYGILEQGWGFVNASKAVQSQKRSWILLNVTGFIRGKTLVSAFVDPLSNPSKISFDYNLTDNFNDFERPISWLPLSLQEKIVKNGVFTAVFDSYRISDPVPDTDKFYLILRARNGESNSMGEDKAFVYLDNYNISGIDEQEVYRAGDMLPLNINIKAINESYSSFIDYSLEWTADAGKSWQTEGLLLCDRKGKERINYSSASGEFCRTSGMYDRLFVWNTSHLETGMYALRLKVKYDFAEFEENINNIYLDRSLKKGWPQRIEYDFYNFNTEGLHPLLVDLSGDGEQEILVTRLSGFLPYNTLMAFYANGSLYWERNMPLSFTVPGVGDIDADGSPDILVHVSNYSLLTAGPEQYRGARLYALNSSGEIKQGWPIAVSNDEYPQYLITDINGDLVDDVTYVAKYPIYDKGKYLPGIVAPRILVISKGTIVSEWNISFSSMSEHLAVGNANSDSSLEFFLLSHWISRVEEPFLNGLRMQIYDKNGKVLYLWNISREIWSFSSPTTVNIDGQGASEVAFTYTNTTGAYLSVNHVNGTLVRGFPFGPLKSIVSPPYIVRQNSIPGSVSVGDIDADGKLDFAFSLWGSYPTGYGVYAVLNNGSLLQGWPQKASHYSSTSDGPILADVSGDGRLDILLNDNTVFPSQWFEDNGTKHDFPSAGILAWHSNGSRVSDFPKGTSPISHVSPRVGDIDADGKLDIVGVSSVSSVARYLTKGSKTHSLLYVWETNSSVLVSHQQWLSPQKDSSSTACFDCSDIVQGNTTKLSYLEGNVSALTFERPNIGKVVFTKNVSIDKIKSNRTMQRSISILRNKIGIDTLIASELNLSAEIYFYGLNITNPKILYNGELCPINICVIGSFNSSLKTLNINVSHFSTFEAVESPVCGDSVCQAFIGESCSMCAQDCGSCPIVGQGPVAPSGNGGSTTTGAKCVSQWNCTLSQCNTGVQIKHCVDVTKCSNSVQDQNLSCIIPGSSLLAGNPLQPNNISSSNVSTGNATQPGFVAADIFSGYKLILLIIAILLVIGAAIIALVKVSQKERFAKKFNIS